MSLLSVKNLSVSYQQTRVINGLELAIEQGEIVALFGPSGCGKTTVLKSVAGLLEQVTGDIELAGRTVLANAESVATEKRKVGLIFQDYALFPHLTIAQNIAFGLTGKQSKEQIAQTVSDMLALIKLSEYAQSYPSQLSGGQQQRVAIVRALACEPDILLFDEAFSNIDPQFRFALIKDIRDLLKQQNIAALFVTHNQDEAFAFCDRIAVMSAGKIEQLDTAETLFAEPKSKFVAEFLGAGFWLQAKVIAEDKLLTSLGEMKYLGKDAISEAVGQQVEVYLRPHQVQIKASESGQYQVQQERFVGDSYHSLLEVNGQPLTVKGDIPLLGQQVELTLPSSVTKIFCGT